MRDKIPPLLLILFSISALLTYPQNSNALPKIDTPTVAVTPSVSELPAYDPPRTVQDRPEAEPADVSIAKPPLIADSITILSSREEVEPSPILQFEEQQVICNGPLCGVPRAAVRMATAPIHFVHSHTNNNQQRRAGPLRRLFRRL